MLMLMLGLVANEHALFDVESVLTPAPCKVPEMSQNSKVNRVEFRIIDFTANATTDDDALSYFQRLAEE